MPGLLLQITQSFAGSQTERCAYSGDAPETQLWHSPRNTSVLVNRSRRPQIHFIISFKRGKKYKNNLELGFEAKQMVAEMSSRAKNGECETYVEDLVL